MLWNARSLIGFGIHTSDGDIGTIIDLYFDDATWTVLYLVVETGSWLSAKEILLSSSVARLPDWPDRRVSVSVTREQVKASPDVSTKLPVSQRKERELAAHYGWWLAHLEEQDKSASAKKEKEEARENSDGESNLRSVDAVVGYAVLGVDGKAGEVYDFLLGKGIWTIGSIIVRTSGWPLDRRVALPSHLVREIRYRERSVHVGMSVDEVKQCREFLPFPIK